MKKDVARLLLTGCIGVMPTDTLYGVVASARNRKAVARLYRLRRATTSKPFIILLSSSRALRAFSVSPTLLQKRFLQKIWPGKVSAIFSVPNKKLQYLHRGTQTLAFRVPANRRLRKLISKTGPLVAPSANTEGKPPARSIKEARAYFGEQVDFYAPTRARLNQIPSTIISLVSKRPRIVREGAVTSAFLLGKWDNAVISTNKKKTRR